MRHSWLELLIVKRLAFLVALLCAGLSAQRMDPVQWSLTVEPAQVAPGGKVLAKLTAKVEPGWHLYSLSLIHI